MHKLLNEENNGLSKRSKSTSTKMLKEMLMSNSKRSFSSNKNANANSSSNISIKIDKGHERSHTTSLKSLQSIKSLKTSNGESKCSLSSNREKFIPTNTPILN
jgi:hypothetical protein